MLYKIALRTLITTMEFPQLLKHIKASTITITLLDDQLKIDAPKGSLTKPIIASLKNNKESLVNLLKEDGAALSGYSFKNNIQPAEKKAYYPLSSPQKRLYFLNQFDTASTEYNMPQIIRIEGQLNIEKLEGAFKKLIERHESFRTSFHVINNEPVQKVEDACRFKMTSIKALEEDVSDLVDAFIKPFDLKSAPLLNVQVIETGQEHYVLMIDKHHIISDGVSEAQITSEIIQYYNDIGLPTLKVQYKDYVEWTLTKAQQDKKKDSETFWYQQFEETLEPLELPLDYKRPIHKSFKGDTVDFQLTVAQTNKLKAIAQTEQTTLFMLLLSIYNILLSKLSGQEDIVIGSPIAGRTHADLEGVIGMFVNTLPLRSYPKSELSFNQFLKTVKETVIKSFEYQNQPLEELIDTLQLERDTSRSPLFDVLFAFQNIESEEVEINGLKFKPYDNEIKVAKYEQNLSCFEQDNQLYFNFEYVSDLYKRETIERFIGYFKSIVNQVIENTSIVLGTITVIANEEKHKVLYAFNDTAISYSKDKTIVGLFEDQVKAHGNTKAVILNNKSITYNELDVLSNNLAQILIEQGVTKENAVGIYLDRSIEMIVAILGILKSGGAYLPLDITQPKARVETILNDSNCKHIITDSKGEGKYNTSCLETNIETISKENQLVRFKHKVQPTDLAYYLYTSGSTGTPKGVMVEHHSVVNLIEDRICTYNITSGERILLFAPIYFDASVEQMLVALLSGSSVVVIEKETLLNTTHFNNYLLEHKVTHLNVVPSFLREMTFSKQLQLKRIITGGEAIDVKTARKCVAIAPLFNAYGPTESTVTSTSRKYTNADRLETINIGKPLSNTTCYVLDKNGNVCPIGVQGELHLGGVGVSRGYVNNTELTNKSFIESPFKAGERLYKTGDLVKWDQSGNLDYLGRVDHQVKIRGHRIELGEIEKPLLDYPEIVQSVVLVKGKENDARLVAYYTATTPIEEAVLKAYLKTCLPSYMVPSYLIELPEFPLMNNGKLNRKQLPDPDYTTTIEYKAPTTTTEKELVIVWSELLGLDAEKISATASFFEVGGHSLKAISLINRIQEVFNVEISLKQVFSKTTIEAIGKIIDNTSKSELVSIPKAEVQQYYPLSSAQRRMYVLYEFDKSGVGYNMPQAYKILGTIEVERFENTFKTLIQRRENLRTIFKLKEEDVVQEIIGAEHFKIKQINVDTEDISNVISNEIQPFNLNEDYPIRVTLITTHTNDTILFIDMHHIVSDGQSQNIVLKEFWELYNNKTQAPLQLQYKDYAVWQQSKTQQDLVNNEKTFWLETFEALPNAITLPTDFERPLVTTHEGSVFNLELTKETTQQLRVLSKQQGVTMFMLLLGVSKILLSKLSNQKDIVLGTITSGRNHRDLEDMMGMFVNTLVLRNEVNPTKDFLTFLKAIKHNILQAFENQSYQYDELVEVLELERDTSRNPLFDIMYSYQRNTTSDLENEIIHSDLKIDENAIDLEVNSSKFDITIAVLEDDDTIQVAFEYSTALFKLETIERFATYFNTILNTVLSNSDVLLKDINILSKAEEALQIDTFNKHTIAYDTTVTLYERFKQQVALHPNRAALLFNSKTISYKALETQANSLAHQLINLGVQKESTVGIYLDRSPKMIVAILGILKSGGTYLPLDIEQPQERINTILEDSNCKHIILEDKTKTIRFPKCDEINIDSETLLDEKPEVVSTATPDSLAYLLYTSGSTGTPKGVMVEHCSVINLIEDRIRTYSITSEENILLFAPIYFDASVEQLFVALLSGAGLVIIEKETLLDPTVFNNYIVEHKVTHLNAVPSFLREIQLTKTLGLKRIVSGGEAIDLKTAKQCVEIATLFNAYGPTETTVTATGKKYTNTTDLKRINIGSPLANTSCYVLDQNEKLCPIGVQGELYIGGMGVARGYVNNEKLTNDRFIPNPFKAGERLYRTGDLVKWLPQGELDYLGRVDHQVKIRGHRIELGEIEQVLLKHPNIVQSVVLLNGTGNDAVLVGYYTINDEVEADVIQTYLKACLPAYMVPNYLIELPEFPLMNNGKLNRKQLPEPNYITTAKYKAPSTKTEEQLVLIWSKLLKLDAEKISATASFFEVGGHSLKAISLINRIQEVFNVEISLKQVFSKTTIEAIGKVIDNTSKSELVAIPKAEVQQYYPLSSAQRRMYVLYEFDKSGVGYNMPQAYKILGNVEIERLENTFKTLIQRRENLRTIFKLKEEDVVQEIIGAEHFKIKQINVDTEDISNAISNEIQPFNLNEDYPIRVILITTHTNEKILFIDMHHIVSDGQSQNILLKEFWELYNNKTQAPLQLQYKDYAVWQQSKTQQDLVNNEKTFWLETFEALPNAITLPTDFERPLVTTYEGSVFSLELTTKTTQQLRALSKQQDVTTFMLLLGVSNILLSKLSNQEDIVLGTITSGRNHRDLENMMGMFVNTLVLRNEVKADYNFKTFIEVLKENTLQAFENQSYQYDDLVEALELERDTSRNPLFDIMYSYQRNTTSDLENEVIHSDLKIDENAIDLEVNSSKFDTTIAVLEDDDTIQVAFEYSTALFKLETIERFATYFNTIIDTILSNSAIQVKDINILSKAEEALQIETFNTTTIAYDATVTLYECFKQQVALHPNRAALLFNTETISYKALETQANSLAHQLIDLGVQKESTVGIYLDRSPKMIVAILGILKSGGTYLPLDIEQPQERINTILEDSNCKHIILEDKTNTTRFTNCDEINIDTADLLDEKPEVISTATPDSLAYLLYTSGSTGTPKGVMVEHHSVVNLIEDRIRTYNITSEENILLFAPIYFDASVEQLFIALLSGAGSVIIEKETLLDPTNFNAYVLNHKVTHIHAVPSFLREIQLTKTLGLKRIVSGGEAIDLKTAKQCVEVATLFNTYGPTETTVTSTGREYTDLTDIKRITIGSPLANTSCYVLNQNEKLGPIGVQGELFIGGVGVARGYLNNEKLTNDRFIPNPFKAGERLYKTGDLVKWLPQGELDYLGRVDHQVKIRGHRIELGEIEQVLLKHPNIVQSVVLLNGTGNDAALVGYYTVNDEIEADAIKTYLYEVLPKYMVPAYLIQLPVFPLMNNGKLNRKRLPEPEYKATANYEAPTNTTEEKLVEIWSELLDIKQDTISITTSFFELGGHSLKVIRLIHIILKTFNTKIAMVTVFQKPTIREIAICIDDETLHDTTGNDEVILLKKEETDNNIFFIHDGSGEVSGYLELTKHITAFNSWGIKSPSLNNTFPSDTTLKTIAANYIEKIKIIQPEGAYHIFGWSFGGNIAYEIVKQLEQHGDTIASFTIIDSKIPFVEDIETETLIDFSVENEKVLINTLLKIKPEFFKEEHTVASLWQTLTNYLIDTMDIEALKANIPEAMKALIPNFDFIDIEDLIKAINTIRTLDGAVSKYIHSTQPNTPITYFKASASSIDIEKVKLHFNTQSEYIEVEGNHFSILKNKMAIRQIANTLNSISKIEILENI